MLNLFLQSSLDVESAEISVLVSQKSSAFDFLFFSKREREGGRKEKKPVRISTYFSTMVIFLFLHYYTSQSSTTTLKLFPKNHKAGSGEGERRRKGRRIYKHLYLYMY